MSRNGVRSLRRWPPRGIVGPILFTVVVVIQGLLRHGYSPVADPISALATGPNGWVQNLNFIVLGSLLLAQAVGLHLGMRPAGRGWSVPRSSRWLGWGPCSRGSFRSEQSLAASPMSPWGTPWPCSCPSWVPGSGLS